MPCVSLPVPCLLVDEPCLCAVKPAVSAAEDPEKILDQAVTDMQTDLIRLRQAAAEVRMMMLPTSQVKCWHIQLCVYTHGDTRGAWQAGDGRYAEALLHRIKLPQVARPVLCSCFLFLLQVTASQKRLQNKYELAQQTADDWYR